MYRSSYYTNTHKARAVKWIINRDFFFLRERNPKDISTKCFNVSTRNVFYRLVVNIILAFIRISLEAARVRKITLSAEMVVSDAFNLVETGKLPVSKRARSRMLLDWRQISTLGSFFTMSRCRSSVNKHTLTNCSSPLVSASRRGLYRFLLTAQFCILRELIP